MTTRAPRRHWTFGRFAVRSMCTPRRIQVTMRRCAWRARPADGVLDVKQPADAGDGAEEPEPAEGESSSNDRASSHRRAIRPRQSQPRAADDEDYRNACVAPLAFGVM